MKHIYVGVIVPLAILLPLFFAALNWKRTTAEARVVFYYLLVSAVVSLAAKLMAMNKTNNLPLLHLYTVIEFILVSTFYQKVAAQLQHAKDKPGSSKFFLLLQIGFVLACVINDLNKGIYSFNSHTLSLGALLLMLLAVNYFARLFTRVTDEPITAIANFWFNTGFFLYFAGSFIFYVFSNYMLLESARAFNIILNLRASFVLLMYILFVVGFVKCRK